MRLRPRLGSEALPPSEGAFVHPPCPRRLFPGESLCLPTGPQALPERPRRIVGTVAQELKDVGVMTHLRGRSAALPIVDRGFIHADMGCHAFLQ